MMKYYRVNYKIFILVPMAHSKCFNLLRILKMLLKSPILLFTLHFILETVIASEEANGEERAQKLNQDISVEKQNQEKISHEKLNQEQSEPENLNFEANTKQHLNQLEDNSNKLLQNQGSEASREQTMKKDSTSLEQEQNSDEYTSLVDEHNSDESSNSNENDEITTNFINKTNDEPGFDLTPEEIEKFKIWKNGVIPYYIDAVSFSDKVARETIRSHLQKVNGVAGISFVELPSPPSDENTRWVFFLNRRGLLGCGDHSVKDFTNKGVQKVVLGYNCMATSGEIAEAVMSIVGVPAQHNDPRRDEYITVSTENIMPDKKYLFEKVGDGDWLFHDLPYDFSSITHYDYNRYSINGHATIEPKESGNEIYPGGTFSAIDILKIKMLYNYITRNKKVKPSECKKLFKRGYKFRNQKPDSAHEIKPRPKPRQYGGEGDGDYNILDTRDENKEEQDETDAKEISDSKSTDDETNQNNNNKRVSLKQKVNQIDLLSYLSDYHTDDNPARKKKLKGIP